MRESKKKLAQNNSFAKQFKGQDKSVEKWKASVQEKIVESQVKHPKTWSSYKDWNKSLNS